MLHALDSDPLVERAAERRRPRAGSACHGAPKARAEHPRYRSGRGLLLDYGTVDGVRFPSRIEETIGEFPGVTFVDRVEVNPTGVDEMFRRDRLPRR